MGGCVDVSSPEVGVLPIAHFKHTTTKFPKESVNKAAVLLYFLILSCTPERNLSSDPPA